MNTVQEALFKAMLQEEWFVASDGDVEFSLGYFGWTHNHPSEWFEVSQAFCEVLTAYAPELELGGSAPDWFTGVFFCSINSDGIIRIQKLGDVTNEHTNTWDFNFNSAVKDARKQFDITLRDYIDWSNDQDEE